MKVIWRQNGKDWEIAEGRRYADEAHLQEFLAQNPSLIPFEDISKEILPPRVMIREVGLPGSGNTDIVGVNEIGDITIVECKLATNPEIKRKVIGQVLEYAAYMWRKPYAELDRICEQRIGQTLAAAVHSKLEPEASENWSDADFVQSVTQTLQDGDFRLVVAVDVVNDELRRTIEYLNQGPSQMAIYALEVNYFSNEGGEILVPHLHGLASAGGRTVPRGVTTQWNAERFFENAEANKLPVQVLETLRGLLEFCESEASRVYWGTGKQTGSFTFHLQKQDRTYSLFSVYSDGRLAINLGWLKDNVPLDVLRQYWQNLQANPAFQRARVREDFNSWPSVRINEAFRTSEELEQFKQAVLGFRDQIANS